MNEAIAKLILDRLDALDDRLYELVQQVAGLNVRAGIWGALAGLVPACLALAWVVLRSV